MKTNSAFGPLQIAIAGLTVAAAMIHISLLFPNTLFILNGLGYLVLLAFLYLPNLALVPYRNIVRWLLIAYTMLTAMLWVFWGARTPIGYLTILVEAALIVLLWIEGRRAFRDGADAPSEDSLETA